jgi:MFS family permease
MTKTRSTSLIILCGCILGFLSFGPRSALGFFMQPISEANGWGRDVLSITIAIQNLCWGIGQPFIGAIADKYGSLRVFWAGAVMYALGISALALPLSPIAMHITSGILFGFGLAGVSFNLVLAVFGKVLPEEKRSFALGIGTAAASFGQVVFAPLAVALMAMIGWQNTLFMLAASMIFIIPLSFVLATNPAEGTSVGAMSEASAMTVLLKAFRFPSYVLLVLGFFTCGFQLAFVTAHYPSYLNDVGVGNMAIIAGGTLTIGAVSMLLIGLFNVGGSLSAGWIMERFPKRWLLALIYFGRAGIVLALMMLPSGAFSAMLFAVVMGLLWLSTVPPTSSLVALMFGTRHMAMLYGFAFFSHQVGGFLGVLLGGIAFEKFGSYDLVWWTGIFFAVVSGLINLPIKEKPVDAAVFARA